MNSNNSLGTFRFHRNRAIKASARDMTQFGHGPMWSDPDMPIAELKRTHGFVAGERRRPKTRFRARCPADGACIGLEASAMSILSLSGLSLPAHRE